MSDTTQFILSSMLYSGDYDFDVPQVPLTNPDLNLAFDVLSNPRRPDSRLVVMSGGAGTFAILSLYQHRYMEWAGYARALFSFGQVTERMTNYVLRDNQFSSSRFRCQPNDRTFTIAQVKIRFCNIEIISRSR